MSPEEYFGKILPLGGGPGTVGKVTLGLSTTPTSIDMRTLFGKMDGGSHFTFKAEGPAPVGATLINWKAYLAMTARPGNVVSGASGLTPAASGFSGWPLSDMQEIEGHLVSGRAVVNSTVGGVPTGGFATLLDHRILNISCSVGSGLLHVRRSTLQPGQDAAALRPPVGSAIFPPGPSGGWGPRP